MNQKELINLLKKMTFLMLFFFILFIISLNFLKLIDFIIKIDNVIKIVSSDNEAEIPKINSVFNNDENNNIKTRYDQNIAHSAEQLGYIDCLSSYDVEEWSHGYNILLIGSDKKNFHIKKSRADVIIVIRISNSGKILSISIPRDSLITISSGKYNGHLDKIGHSMFWNGVEQLKINVERLISVKIDKTIVVDNFRSFEAFTAILGGVSIDKMLEGKLGIQWIRNRSFKYGDIERCKRQQIFLKKSIAKLWELSKKGNYLYSIFTYKALSKIVDTDIEEDDFSKILYLLKRNSFNPVMDYYTAVLPGKFGVFDSKLLYRKNLTCWILDKNYLEKLQLTFNPDNKNVLSEKKIGFIDFYKLNLKEFSVNFKNKMKKNLQKTSLSDNNTDPKIQDF